MPIARMGLRIRNQQGGAGAATTQKRHREFVMTPDNHNRATPGLMHVHVRRSIAHILHQRVRAINGS